MSQANCARSLITGLALMATGLWSPVTRAQDSTLHVLRSAYLYYFAHLIRWPAETAFAGHRFNLCAATDDPEDHFQLRTVDNKPLREGRLHIEIITSHTPLDKLPQLACHLLFIAEGAAPERDVIALLTTAETLRVTEGASGDPGAIHLFTRRNKLRFHIDRTQLRRQGFWASSKLLRLSSDPDPDA